MPQRYIHCEFTYRRYGVTGEDIHKWMDAPWVYLGVKHRIKRHDYSDWIPKRFVKRYGIKKAKAVMRSHIWLDDNWPWYQYFFYQ